MSGQVRKVRYRSDRDRPIGAPAILLVVAAATLILYELQLVLLPFVLAGVTAYVCTPALDAVSKAAHLPRALVATLAFLLILALAAGVALLGVPPMLREIKHTITDFDGTVNGLVQGTMGSGEIDLLGMHTDAGHLTRTITAAVRASIGNWHLLAVLGGSVLVSGMALVLTLVLLFFFMIGGPALGRRLLWLVPPQWRELVADHILSNLHPALRRYFIGVLAVVAFAAVFAYVGLGVVLGIPHAAFLALLSGFLEAIPLVGPVAAAAIAGLVALHHNPGLTAIIGYAIYIAALRLSIDQFFGPIVLGSAARLHPALIILCFLAGGTLFGIMGVILAVPVALITRESLAVLYDEPAGGTTG